MVDYEPLVLNMKVKKKVLKQSTRFNLIRAVRHLGSPPGGISCTDCCLLCGLLCDESWLHRAQLSSPNTKDQSHQLHRNDMGVVKWAKHTTSAHWLGARATSKDFMRNANLMVNPTGIYRTQGSTISLVHSESLKAPSVHSPQHSLWQ